MMGSISVVPVPTVLCLSKQGHRFLSTFITANNDSDNRRLIRKFVSSSSQHVSLTTLSHLLSPAISHPPRLSSLALPLYLEITQASWFRWNSKLVAHLVALLYKLDRFHDAQILLTQTLSKLGTHSCTFYSHLILSLAKHNSPTGVAHFSSQLKLRSPSPRGYASIIQAFCIVGLPAEAEQLIQQHGLKLSKFEYRALLYSYGKLGCFADMERIVDQMGFELDTVTSNMVLHSFGSHNDLSQMAFWLQKGVPFSLRTYNSVLNSCPTLTLLLQHPKTAPLSLQALMGNLSDKEAHLVKMLVGSSVVLEEAMQWKPLELKLDLHGMHPNTAYLIILHWFHHIQTCRPLPPEITLVCGAGKHSAVRGHSPVKRLIKEILLRMGCPLRIDRNNIGCFIAKGKTFAHWVSNYNALNMESTSSS